MKLLRFFFNLQTIYFKQTLMGIAYFYLLVALGIWLAVVFGQDGARLPSYAFAPVYVIAVYALLRTLLRTYLVEKFVKQYRESLLVIPPREVAQASINLELDNIDQLNPIAAHKNARMFIATFNFYRETKLGEHLTKKAYYTVLEVQLKRRLPHILFDSKTAKNRQFKHFYLRAQRISIQGTFDEVFDTYVPQTYTIDSLSFITPEVMEAIVEANAYDLEIVNDKLLLYAPLIGKEDQATLFAKGRTLARHLNDNIDTYRDDRLTGVERRTDVTLFARTMLRSPRKYLYAAGVSAVLIAVIFYIAVAFGAEFRNHILFNSISLLIYITFFGNCWEAGKIMRNNNQAHEKYRILYQTGRGKPIKNTII